MTKEQDKVDDVVIAAYKFQDALMSRSSTTKQQTATCDWMFTVLDKLTSYRKQMHKARRS